MLTYYKYYAILTLFISLDTIPANPVHKKAHRLSKNLDFKLEINLPEFIQNLTGLRFDRSRSKNDGVFKIQLGIPDFIKTMNTLGRIIKRRTFAYVELGPGAFKSEIVTYPPKYHESQLKKLLKLKERMEKKQVNLNQGKEFFRK